MKFKLPDGKEVLWDEYLDFLNNLINDLRKDFEIIKNKVEVIEG